MPNSRGPVGPIYVEYICVNFMGSKTSVFPLQLLSKILAVQQITLSARENMGQVTGDPRNSMEMIIIH